MSYYGWKPYVSVGERKKQAEKAAAKAKKAGKMYSPIAAYRGALAKTVWGTTWCDNLEAHSDYASRLPRGRTYVRNGSVIDLQISAGKVQALVMGSSLYEVEVTVKPVAPAQWKSICKDCSGSIASLVEILQGKLSTSVMQRLCQPGTGLMPMAKALKFSCSCPDWADMCKHVAAVLYGVGARLDHQPELLFTLCNVDAKDLIQAAGSGLAAPRKAPTSAKVLDEAFLDDVFGLEMAEALDEVVPAKKIATKRAAAKKVAVSKVMTGKIAAKKPAAKKAAAVKEATAVKVVAKRAATKKVAAKKVVAVKAPVKKLAAKKAVAVKSAPEKVTPKKPAVKKPSRVTGKNGQGM
ncbi:MAG: SWIM zinc finger family protein [Pseudomonadota bacterium]